MKQPLHVAAAAIYRDQRVLLSRRLDHVHQGGKWEFPGGKLESGETVLEALSRELQEELAISPVHSRPLIRVHHAYTDLSVLLDVWRVDAFSGNPVGVEGQEVRWFDLSDLPALNFPAANLSIVKAAMLPELMPAESLPGYTVGEDYVIWNADDGIDWPGFQAFTERASLPVYLDASSEHVSLERVWEHGGQGCISRGKA